MVQTLETVCFEFLSVLLRFRDILGVPSSAPEQMDAGWLWESHHGVRVVVEAGITTRSNPHPEEAHLEYSLMSYCSCHGSSLILGKVGIVVELELPAFKLLELVVVNNRV